MSSKTLSLEPNKLLENKEAKTIEKGRTTKHCSNSSTVDSRQSKGKCLFSIKFTMN